MKKESASFIDIPSTFQASTIAKISKVIKDGGSLQLVGIPGIGSSMIVKLLIQKPEIQKRYFGPKFTFISIDANTLIERKSIDLMRLLMSSLAPTLGPQTPSDEANLNKVIESKLEELCLVRDLVIVIDHLDELNYPEFRLFFTNLYCVFRILQPKIHLISVVNKPISKAEQIENFGPMGRVIIENILRIELLNYEDSYWFTKESERKMGIKLSLVDRKKIIKLSGGFTRTIKRLVESQKYGYKLPHVADNPEIYLPLALHLEELSVHQEVLGKIEILDRFIANRSKSTSGEIVGGLCFATKLTKNEEKLLKIFSSMKGEIVSREVGIERLWGSKTLDVSDHAYDQLILRLRQKLQGSTPRADIETIRGRGHMFRIK